MKPDRKGDKHDIDADAVDEAQPVLNSEPQQRTPPGPLTLHAFIAESREIQTYSPGIIHAFRLYYSRHAAMYDQRFRDAWDDFLLRGRPKQLTESDEGTPA